MTQITKSKALARLEARISPETKALMQKAAALEGRSLTDFVVASAQAAALKVIEQHQTLQLTIADSQAFVDALLRPSEPNSKLKKAALRHQQIIEIDGVKN
ncbi:sll7031 (plasmid) [Synechocystis sp. PCC 6803]|jgi:uncharacterized protein (DUF1778 family)|uniref:Sll7031 protein n=1 Tax=Synechocystis sp. (strain ATCC 27184 / PCC 6803 / Kazusa) TaxID=1111708 RepID=Q6ZEG7_SYNY3|nr:MULTISPECIES: DUF1778 domain-containing protein [unclassified Synechocystis]AGF53585.1 hypothetical protein MYO_4290 [Synechocystis sp. PCC 6803]AVP91437.1 DUF1778 domain-containing protein [Synechocystis sp. IPPAS B-1465]MBD2618935.1 DUF1778 domain-containing protein [Synechocystis sp. FACHB-898]MBD2637426.1 DUF1778 domain-containing protein [Synechocystis sp. FACHB-908]MBD2661555.1 DUF1778 domain-containing protein [Synechocystis sp. FACHB-929]